MVCRTRFKLENIINLYIKEISSEDILMLNWLECDTLAIILKTIKN
jgi:hypothetical protein